MRAKKLAAVASVGAVLAAAALCSTARAAAPQAQGIGIHGAWTIQVRDHGKVVRTLRFHNSLNPFGGALIARILTRQSNAGAWGIRLAAANTKICASNDDNCYITEPGTAGLADDAYTLSVTVPTSGPDTGKIVLKGSVVVTGDGTIIQVATQLRECAANTLPSLSCGFALPDITDRDLGANPVAVVQGQQVLVTVKLSFQTV